MHFLGSIIVISDPIIEYYKQFVDRKRLRANLMLTVDERLRRLQQSAVAEASHGPRRGQPPSPARPWQPVSDCGPNRASDPIIELYKRDVDRTLLRANLRRTLDQRFDALAEMARLVEEMQAAGRRLHRSS
jgi:hypothetical protein